MKTDQQQLAAMTIRFCNDKFAVNSLGLIYFA